MIWTGSHTHAASNATVVINEDNAIIIMVGSRHRANVDAWSVLTLEAWCRHEITTPTGEVHLIDLNPLLPVGDKMTGDASLRALGWCINSDAPLTFLQVNDHAPGTNFFLC